MALSLLDSEKQHLAELLVAIQRCVYSPLQNQVDENGMTK
jgi:hypothetical protein